MMRSVDFFLLCLLAAVAICGCSDSSDSLSKECPETDPDNPGNRLVVVGHSYPSGYHDANVHPESQRWVYPAYIAERLGATYAEPELGLGMAAGGATAPDLRSLFAETGLIMSPYHDVFDLPPYDTKARPEERHTNLAVPGALLSQALQFDFASVDACEVGHFACLFHFAANSSPYTDLVEATGTWPSQVDIAVYLKPRWILVNIGGNDVSARVDPVVFENSFREMLDRLTKCNSAARIIVANVQYSFAAPRNVTASEADQLLGLSPGTSSLAYYGAIGVIAGPEDLFPLMPFSYYLLGALSTPPPLVTPAEQRILEELKETYNQSIQNLVKEFRMILWDADGNFKEFLLNDGLEVTIDGSQYQLTNDYGGGLWSFEGGHVGKTMHAWDANSIINILNQEAQGEGDSACVMPPVDVDAAACGDLHVRRALGLSENPDEFSCPPPDDAMPCED